MSWYEEQAEAENDARCDALRAKTMTEARMRARAEEERDAHRTRADAAEVECARLRECLARANGTIEETERARYAAEADRDAARAEADALRAQVEAAWARNDDIMGCAMALLESDDLCEAADYLNERAAERLAVRVQMLADAVKRSTIMPGDRAEVPRG